MTWGEPLHYVMAARKWTDEQRRQQAEKIRQWRPWEQATGPISAKGKAVSSQNGFKHGLRSRAFNQVMHELQELIKN